MKLSDKTRGFWRLVTSLTRIVALGVLVVGLITVVKYADRLVAIRRGTLDSPVTSNARSVQPSAIRFVEVRPGRRDSVTLALATERALVLVYSTTCSVCDMNMPRWLDLISELQTRAPNTPVYAIDVDGRDTLLQYWPRLAGVRVLMPINRRELEQYLHVPGTPASVVTAPGRIETVALGVVGRGRRSHLVSLLTPGS